MRILLVEDDADLQRLLKRALSDAGYVVDAAGDGEAMPSKVSRAKNPRKTRLRMALFRPWAMNLR